MNIEIPVVSSDNVRTIKDPNGLEKRRTVTALIRLCDLPEIPLNPDPRIPKRQSEVVKRIVRSAASNDGKFHEKNRGITLCAATAEFDNRSNIFTLVMPDNQEDGLYGIIDGGHTHYAIHRAVDEARGSNGISEVLLNQFVRLEVMVGVEGDLASIADARNFSAPLKQWGLENYKGKFDWFLDALGDGAKYVRVKENEDKPVPIMDLIQIMCASNPVLFPKDEAPLEAYKNAGKCLEYFVADNDPHCFTKLAPVAQDIMRLYDYVRYYWDAKYNEVDVNGKRGRVDRRAEMSKRQRNRDSLLNFYFYQTDDKPSKKEGLPVEKGFALPVISAFRALLQRNEPGDFHWSCDPFKFFDDYGNEMVREVMDASSVSGGDAHLVGRERTIYTALYRIARIGLLEQREAERESLQ